MLRKIDCVTIRVPDPGRATAFYRDAFGLEPLWHYDGSIGLGFPHGDAEIVLHANTEIPAIDVSYLVDDVQAAVKTLVENGCELLVPPEDIRIGMLAVVRDPFDVTLTILDTTKGLVEPNWPDDA